MSFITTSDVPITDGLVAAFIFRQNVEDKANNYNGTVSGTETYVVGQSGFAFSFNNSTSIDLPNMGFSGDTSISIIVGHKIDAGAGSSNNFFGFGSAGTSNTVCAFRTRGDGGYRFYFWGNDLDAGTSTYYGSWTHSAATYSSSASRRRIYHNGSVAASDTPSNPSFNDTSYSISGFNGETVEGAIDHVLIYNRELSSTEVEKLRQHWLA